MEYEMQTLTKIKLKIKSDFDFGRLSEIFSGADWEEQDREQQPRKLIKEKEIEINETSLFIWFNLSSIQELFAKVAKDKSIT